MKIKNSSDNQRLFRATAAALLAGCGLCLIASTAKALDTWTGPDLIAQLENPTSRGHLYCESDLGQFNVRLDPAGRPVMDALEYNRRFLKDHETHDLPCRIEESEAKVICSIDEKRGLEIFLDRIQFASATDRGEEKENRFMLRAVVQAGPGFFTPEVDAEVGCFIPTGPYEVPLNPSPRP